MDDIKLHGIPSCTLPVHRELLLEVIAIEVIPAWSDVPGAIFIAIDAVEVKITNESRPVVFGDIASIG